MTWQPHVVICCRVFRTVVRRNCNPRVGASDFGPGACEPAAALRTEMRLWVPETDGIHVQTRPRTGRSQSGAGDPPPEQAPGPRQRHARPIAEARPGTPQRRPAPAGRLPLRALPRYFSVCRKNSRARPPTRREDTSRIANSYTVAGRAGGLWDRAERSTEDVRTPSKFDTTYGRRSRPRLANESARRHGAKRHLLTSRV